MLDCNSPLPHHLGCPHTPLFLVLSLLLILLCSSVSQSWRGVLQRGHWTLPQLQCPSVRRTLHASPFLRLPDRRCPEQLLHLDGEEPPWTRCVCKTEAWGLFPLLYVLSCQLLCYRLFPPAICSAASFNPSSALLMSVCLSFPSLSPKLVFYLLSQRVFPHCLLCNISVFWKGFNRHPFRQWYAAGANYSGENTLTVVCGFVHCMYI